MRGRDFTLLWSASVMSQFGSICSATANPLLALLLTHSPIFAGWVVAAGTIPPFLMHLPAGWLVDRFNRRRLMFVSQFGRLAACGIVIGALTAKHPPLAIIILAAFCEETFLVLYNTAEITAVKRVVKSEKLPSALAMNEARIHVAVMAGKSLGGFLFGVNKTFPYALSACASIWSIGAMWIMNSKNYQPAAVDRPPGSVAAKPPRISILSAAKVVLLNSFLRTVVVVCAVGNFLFQILLLLLVVMAEHQRMSGAGIGLLLAISGVCGLAGSIIAPTAGKRIRDKRHIITLCVVIWAVLTSIVALAAQPVIGLIAWGGLSATGGLLNVAMSTYQVRSAPEHMLGRVIGINRFFTGGAMSAGALSAGYIVAALQPRVAAALVCIAMIVLMLAVLLRPLRLLPDRMVNWLNKRLSPPAPTSFRAPDEVPEEILEPASA